AFTSSASAILNSVNRVGLVLPDSTLEMLVVSIKPSILPTSSTCEICLDNLTSLILLPTSFRISDFSNLTYLTCQRNCIYLLCIMPYMAMQPMIIKSFFQQNQPSNKKKYKYELLCRFLLSK